MKLLVLSSRFPYPLDKGDKLRLYYQLQSLSKEFEIHLICLTDEPVCDLHYSTIAQYCKSLKVFYQKKSSILLQVLVGFIKGWPVQVSYFFNGKIKKEIYKIISKEKPDHIYCQLIRATEYIKDIPIKKTIDYMDCFSENSFKRSETSNILKKIFWKQEAQRVKKYETSIFAFFDNHILISQSDADFMPLQKKPISIIPNGIADIFFEPIENSKSIDILFVGNLSYYSNIDAVDFIIHQIFPELKKMGIPFRIVIAGKSPSHEMKEWIHTSGQVELLENVPQIEKIYQQARIMVAPITKGTGLQNKVLEALAAGCMVVCSEQVSKGLGAEFSAIRIAKNAEEYVHHILHLHDQYQSLKNERDQSQKYLQEFYSWQFQTNKLIDLIKS